MRLNRWGYLHVVVLQFLAVSRFIWDVAPTGLQIPKDTRLSLPGLVHPFSYRALLLVFLGLALEAFSQPFSKNSCQKHLLQI